MQAKSRFHQRKLGISYHDRNKCRRFLFVNGSLAWSRLGDVVSVGSSNVKAIDDESSELFFPIAWKIVSPSSLPPPPFPPQPNLCQASSCEQNFSAR